LSDPPSEVLRCFGGSDPLYTRYHDEEWGRPVVDERGLYERVSLEAFQSGLSWITILRKREAFRKGFAGFDPAKVAKFGAKDVERLLGDAGIVRHRGKIESTINNAKRALELIDEQGSIAAYVWQFVPPAAERPAQMTLAALRAMGQTPSSLALSKDLKKRGWSFVGPTTMYAFMQAMGMVNDHLEGCVSRATAEAAQRKAVRPAVKTAVARIAAPAVKPAAKKPRSRAG
jgi:DNA-3-methyladenine glycosylase I